MNKLVEDKRFDDAIKLHDRVYSANPDERQLGQEQGQSITNSNTLIELFFEALLLKVWFKICIINKIYRQNLLVLHTHTHTEYTGVVPNRKRTVFKVEGKTKALENRNFKEVNLLCSDSGNLICSLKNLKSYLTKRNHSLF